MSPEQIQPFPPYLRRKLTKVCRQIEIPVPRTLVGCGLLEMQEREKRWIWGSGQFYSYFPVILSKVFSL